MWLGANRRCVWSRLRAGTALFGLLALLLTLLPCPGMTAQAAPVAMPMAAMHCGTCCRASSHPASPALCCVSPQPPAHALASAVHPEPGLEQAVLHAAVEPPSGTPRPFTKASATDSPPPRIASRAVLRI